VEGHQVTPRSTKGTMTTEPVASRFIPRHLSQAILMTYLSQRPVGSRIFSPQAFTNVLLGLAVAMAPPGETCRAYLESKDRVPDNRTFTGADAVFIGGLGDYRDPNCDIGCERGSNGVRGPDASLDGSGGRPVTFTMESHTNYPDTRVSGSLDMIPSACLP
jgi:hypothetical protein